MSCTHTASGQGPVLPVLGASTGIVIHPKASFWLKRMFATGDTGARITFAIAGEQPITTDELDCALLSPSAYHGPTFDGVYIQAGVPVAIQYRTGSTTVALSITLSGSDDP